MLYASVNNLVKQYVELGVQFFEIDNIEEIPNKVDGGPTILGQGLQGQTRAVTLNGTEIAAKYCKAGSPYNSYNPDKKQLATIGRDILSLKLINHSYSVKLLGLSQNKDEIIILMEKALPLKIFHFAEVIKKTWPNREPLTIWMKLFSDLALGCAAMSEAGVQHRDLTLDNILIFHDPSRPPIHPKELITQNWHQI